MVFHLWNRQTLVILEFLFVFRGLKSQNGSTIKMIMDVQLLPSQTAMIPPTSLVLLHVLLFHASSIIKVPLMISHLLVIVISMLKPTMVGCATVL